MFKGNEMKRMFLLCGLILVGCQQNAPSVTPVSKSNPTAKVPVFTHSYSEYPSWSVFGVADTRGIIDGREGHQSELEKKWNVDVVFKLADYDTCLTQFGSNTVSSSCLTALDSLAPSLGRPAVVVLPTSTSDGGDALIVADSAFKAGRDDFVLQELKNVPVYGLEKSVSQYAFERVLESRGLNPKDYTFRNMDPAAAAQAMQTKQPNVNAIMVWNPFVLQTLRTRPDTKAVFSSDVLKEEIVDCVVVGKDALEREGGDRFACCLIEAFYKVNELIDNPSTKDAALIDLGNKFCNLGVEDMKLVCQQTKFYDTPEKGVALLNSQKYRDVTMPMVVEFAVSHEIVPASKNVKRIGFEDSEALLNFTTKYIERFRSGSK